MTHGMDQLQHMADGDRLHSCSSTRLTKILSQSCEGLSEKCFFPESFWKLRWLCLGASTQMLGVSQLLNFRRGVPKH